MGKLHTVIRLSRQKHGWSVIRAISWKYLVQGCATLVFSCLRLFSHKQKARLSLATKHPVAFHSPDHLFPTGTKNDNSTNRLFVLMLIHILKKSFGKIQLHTLDLGCSGGQLVADFRALGVVAAGLEGSDYSLRHKRANWKDLANTALFTCDITKPFTLKKNQRPFQAQLITAWEVLEHIHTRDLKQLFTNIEHHLAPGGFFIASTSNNSDMQNGVELHQTQMTATQWQNWIQKHAPALIPAQLELPAIACVRLGNNPLLIYRKKA